MAPQNIFDHGKIKITEHDQPCLSTLMLKPNCDDFSYSGSASSTMVGSGNGNERAKMTAEAQLNMSLFGAPAKVGKRSFTKTLAKKPAPNLFFNGDCEDFLDHLIAQGGTPLDMTLTSPPYNLGKGYEEYKDKKNLDVYLEWQKRIITKTVQLTKPNGSVCWQVGNYISNGHIVPLDLELAPIFKELGLKLRNRIVWSFGHGLHCKRRFSGRYEVVLWYTKGDDYTFNLDDVRVPSKYPNKKYFKGPRKGQLSGNPLGKNPEDLWTIPNVKHNHVEKTDHPCQFPIALAQRFILALTNPGDVVFDPFMGVGTTPAAAVHLGRNACGSEMTRKYFRIARDRILQASAGNLRFRDHNKPIYEAPKLV